MNKILRGSMGERGKGDVPPCFCFLVMDDSSSAVTMLQCFMDEILDHPTTGRTSGNAGRRPRRRRRQPRARDHPVPLGGAAGGGTEQWAVAQRRTAARQLGAAGGGAATACARGELGIWRKTNRSERIRFSAVRTLLPVRF